MARLVAENKWACSYCDKRFTSVLRADGCEKSHRLIYIALPKEDLMRLIQYIHTGEQKLLSPNLVQRLTAYARIKESNDDVSTVSEADLS